ARSDPAAELFRAVARGDDAARTHGPGALRSARSQQFQRSRGALRPRRRCRRHSAKPHGQLHGPVRQLIRILLGWAEPFPDAAVVRGAQDGYTLLATPSAVAINPSLYGKVPYDLENDLAPVGLINRNAMIVMVNPALGVKSLSDLVARAKQTPMNYAISGNGT